MADFHSGEEWMGTVSLGEWLWVCAVFVRVWWLAWVRRWVVGAGWGVGLRGRGSGVLLCGAWVRCWGSMRGLGARWRVRCGGGDVWLLCVVCVVVACAVDLVAVVVLGAMIAVMVAVF